MTPRIPTEFCLHVTVVMLMLTLVNTDVLATIDKESVGDTESAIKRQHNEYASKSESDYDDRDNAAPAVKSGKSESGHSVSDATYVTTLDETKPIGVTKTANERYDAVTSATSRDSADKGTDHDENGASFDWILIVFLGLIAAVRSHRSSNATKT